MVILYVFVFLGVVGLLSVFGIGELVNNTYKV